jgi:undecaprenyl diphosphate synthase
LLVQAIQNEIEDLMRNNVRLLAIGNLARLPEGCQSQLHDAIEKTKNNTGLTVMLALSYSGRWEITDAVKKIIINNVDEKNITEQFFSTFLNTSGLPDPDMLIRTGCEYRISNFLLWQIAYTELFFPPVLWPDFRKENLLAMIAEYQKRQRRFGKTGKQIQDEN